MKPHPWALASRVAPAVLLCGGLLLWMPWQRPSAAQGFGNPVTGDFRGNGASRPQFQSLPPGTNYPASTGYRDPRIAQVPANANTGSNFPSSIPPAPIEEAPAVAEESDASWEMPLFVQKIMQGGWLMVPLAVCSLIILALSLERLIALRRSRVIPKPFVRRFTECVEDGQLSYDEATSICDEFDCPVADVFHAAVRRWGRPMLEIEQAVIDAGDRVGDSLRRYLRVFHAISNVTPLIGLLGTVLGMIQAFENINGTTGSGQTDLLAAGISTALMTTAGGLSVAIPAYLAYMYFGAKSDGYLGEIDKLCQRVIDCISAEGLENAGSQKASRRRRAA